LEKKLLFFFVCGVTERFLILVLIMQGADP